MATETTTTKSSSQTLEQAASSPSKTGIRLTPSRLWYTFRRWPVIPVVILISLIIMGVFADQLAPQDPIKQSLHFRNSPPRILDGEFYQRKLEANPSLNVSSSHYLLGGDHVGRDVLSRIIHGARISLSVTSVALFSGLMLGVPIGVVAGYYGGIVDEVLMRMVDVWYSIPFLLLAMVFVIIFEASLSLIIFLLILLAWSGYVRNLRGEVLSLKERDYVASARVVGASTLRIMIRHLLPGLINTIFVIASLRVGQLILAEASLSFLGAGIPGPTPAWGVLIADGRDYVESAWWQTVFPGVALFLVVLAFNFIGDWVRDRLDPRLRQLD